MPCPPSILDHGYLDAKGKPVAKRIRYTFRTELVDVTPGELAAATAATAPAANGEAIEIIGPPPVSTKP